MPIYVPIIMYGLRLFIVVLQELQYFLKCLHIDIVRTTLFTKMYTVIYLCGRRSKKAVVSACMKDTVMQKYTVQMLGQQLRRELVSMCSAAANSILQQQAPEALSVFFVGETV